MFKFAEQSMRKSIDRATYRRNMDSITIEYCEECADKYDLPKSLKQKTVLENYCGICGRMGKVVDRLYRDNKRLEKAIAERNWIIGL